VKRCTDGALREPQRRAENRNFGKNAFESAESAPQEQFSRALLSPLQFRLRVPEASSECLDHTDALGYVASVSRITWRTNEMRNLLVDAESSSVKNSVSGQFELGG
jgi:hypothetical protein